MLEQFLINVLGHGIYPICVIVGTMFIVFLPCIIGLLIIELVDRYTRG